MSDSRLATDDPILLLKNEHTVLLGQLRLLERGDLTRNGTRSLLKTLLRGCKVHFKREDILFGVLGPKLGAGGESLDALADEHRELRRKAGELLKQIARPEGSSGSRRMAYLRPLLREFTKQFRTHIQHEEKVVFVLVRTRLTLEQQRRVAMKMLAE